MFEAFDELPPDPILGLMAAFREDSRPRKIDLGVGVYRDESGHTPILEAVARAEQRRIDNETTKAYIGPPGTPEFNQAIATLVYGRNHGVLKDGRVTSVQTPGGCGALRVAADLLKRIRSQARIWVSDPTWANHVPLLGSAGLAIEPYPYYDAKTMNLDADAMLHALSGVSAGDIVLLHGCCHNPSGVDLDPGHWAAIAELANERGFLPFVDLAYQGLGNGLDVDADGVRVLSEQCPEVVVTISCSKNFGLYRERTGALQVVCANARTAGIVQSQLGSVVRGIYSMPPAHGAAIVDIILNDEALSAAWIRELDRMRERINGLRAALATALSAGTGRDFSFIERQRGLFSFLGISPQQVAALRDRFGIYMVDSSRVNVAGLNDANIDYFVDAAVQVMSA